jgi:hypothetical protein
LVYTNIKMGEETVRYAWYLDITPNEMFSFDGYLIAGKRGIPLCQEHGRQLEMKEVVVSERRTME